MATKPATPGTGFTAPLYLLDKDLNVIGEIGGESLQDIDLGSDLTGLQDAVEQIILALGGSIAE